MTAPMTAAPASARQELLRFTLVGAAGFLVDATALTLALGLGLGLYAGRVVSYLCAATFTWACNRRFTFSGARAGTPLAQWARFLGANAIGGAMNYGVYASLVTYSAAGPRWPVLAVAAGSLAGLVFNFAVSKAWVFRRQ